MKPRRPLTRPTAVAGTPLLVALLVLAAGCGRETPTAAPESTVVKIGVAGPLTGRQSAEGIEQRNGAQLAIDDVNAAGLDIGHRRVKLELVAVDDEGDAGQAAAVARQLIGEKASAVIGHVHSRASIAASSVYAEAGVPQLSPATNPNYTRQGFPTTFRLVANDDQLGASLATYAIDTGSKAIAVIDDGTVYGKGLADAFAATARTGGARIVIREQVNGPDADFKSLMARIAAKKPDLVLFGGTDAESATLARGMAAAGLKKRLMGGDFMQTSHFIEAAGAAAEGVLAAAPGLPPEQMPGGQSFQDRYRRQFKTPLGLTAPLAYDAVYVIVGAMQRAESTDPARFRAEIGNTQRNGLTSAIAFDEKGDLKNGPITLYAVKDGRWEPMQTLLSGNDGKAAISADNGKK